MSFEGGQMLGKAAPGVPAGGPVTRPVSLGGDALDQLMPMHVLVCPAGRITRTGPTVAKLGLASKLIDERFLDVFDLRRPHGVRDPMALPAHDGGRLALACRDGRQGSFKGLAVAMPEPAGILVNLSFGFSVIDAVEAYDLSSGDFAPTDLAVEMLYLVEAKSAAMQESRKLNTRLQGAKVAAEEQAFTDTLTGLKNRRAIDHVLGRLLSTGVPFGLMQLDLDFFKQVNDTHGHAAGDEVLQTVARVLVSETRQVDTVARVGGDEFVLVFQGVSGADWLVNVGKRIIARLEEPVAYNDVFCCISGSIGITSYHRRQGASIASLLQEADEALYASKRAGRGRCTVFRQKDVSDGVESDAVGKEISVKPDD